MALVQNELPRIMWLKDIGTALGVVLGLKSDEVHTSATLGTCANSTQDTSTIKVLTFNTFLISCLPKGLDFVEEVRCQTEDEREVRVQEIVNWFANRDEDIVLLQEVWSFHVELRDGMSEAGYCYYIMTEETIGSGLAIFSKHPIDQQSNNKDEQYVSWLNGIAADAESIESAAKGVLHANITKDGHNIHLFNMHTLSDSFGDNHDIRVEQFNIVKDFVDSKDIPSNELVLLGGDFNEEKDCSSNTCNGTEAYCANQSYYNEMIEILSADVPTYNGDSFTYDTEENTLLKGLYSKEDCDYYRYTLDYILYSKEHLIPWSDTSSCEVVYPLDGDKGIDLSDHLPVSCIFSGIGSGATTEAEEETKEEGSSYHSFLKWVGGNV